MLKKEIKKIVQQYRRNIENAGIPIEKMVLFGSYARGNARKDSDIDVCVVSPDFGKDDIEEMQTLFKKSARIDTRIEPYPLSSDEFANGFSPIIDEIRKYGIVV